MQFRKIQFITITLFLMVITACSSQNRLDKCESQQENLRPQCYVLEAIETKDSSLCHLANNQKNECIKRLAVMLKDKNLCQDVLDSDICIKQVNGELAKQNLDSSLCAEAFEPEACYNLIAYQTQNAELCKKITSSNMKNSCLYDVATLSQNVELCDDVNDKDRCITSIAISKGDESLCQLATDTNNCINMINLGK